MEAKKLLLLLLSLVMLLMRLLVLVALSVHRLWRMVFGDGDSAWRNALSCC